MSLLPDSIKDQLMDHLDHPLSQSTSTDRHDVDLAATSRRFRLAREQSASQASTARLRSVALMRWRDNDPRPGGTANRP